MSAGKRLRPGAKSAAGGSKSRKRRRPNPYGPEGSGVKDPVAAFHALLENERLAADNAQALSESQLEGGLMFDERPPGVAMRAQPQASCLYRPAGAAADG